MYAYMKRMGGTIEMPYIKPGTKNSKKALTTFIALNENLFSSPLYLTIKNV